VGFLHLGYLKPQHRATIGRRFAVRLRKAVWLAARSVVESTIATGGRLA
jgi:hypothetical protein